MNCKALILTLAALSATALAQTPAKPTTATAPKAATTPSTAARLPAGIPPVRGIKKTAFSLQYQDIKLGTGADAEPNKSYEVQYTGWLASTGYKFDSSYDHRAPVVGKDGKPVMGPDGKPQLGDPQSMKFPQGFGRLIPGFDQGFYGMKVGGKRRLFIPWQLAYGAKGRPGPDAAHPGIPAKADLIFDVELVSQSEMQMPQGRPGAPGVPHAAPPRPIVPTTPSGNPQPGTTPPTTSTPTPAPAPQATPPATATPAAPTPAPK